MKRVLLGLFTLFMGFCASATEIRLDPNRVIVYCTSVQVSNGMTGHLVPGRSFEIFYRHPEHGLIVIESDSPTPSRFQDGTESHACFSRKEMFEAALSRAKVSGTDLLMTRTRFNGSRPIESGNRSMSREEGETLQAPADADLSTGSTGESSSN